MEFLIPLLGGALGAALVNGVLALYKIKRDRQTDHDQWLRNAKLEAYTEFLAAVSPFKRSRALRQADDEHYGSLYVAIYRLQILGSADVIEASQKAKISVDKLFKEETEAPEVFDTLKALAETMKAELDSFRK
ncbi:hypothetical protein CVCC1112_1732 [Paenarthrobacter nicotinovorans]|uniref:hypothetical protein n=1 Tax=Paenarthrobacter nicotinovorans TaxID=29320 RepID=UPI0007CC8E78|nr:hypothetical protein [Paenarthrobacter nicotinovorans]GAT87073.1 hypothetical protein CVCC1112_1732 [Paenarthrobacter nicotinovorans]